MSEAGPTSFNRPERVTLTPDQIGDVGQAVLTLARELWIVKDRLRVLEAVLDERGLEVHEAVERHQPDPALEQELAEAGKELAGRVVDALRGAYPE